MTILRVAPGLAIDDGELLFEFVQASGPGGQNVNKVATAVRLRFDAAGSPSLSQPQKERLARLAGRRMSREGVVLIQAQRFRSQEQNRRDATERLMEMLRAAALPPRYRRPTAPPKSADRNRLETKKRVGAQKRARRAPPEHD